MEAWRALSAVADDPTPTQHVAGGQAGHWPDTAQSGGEATTKVVPVSRAAHRRRIYPSTSSSMSSLRLRNSSWTFTPGVSSRWRNAREMALVPENLSRGAHTM
jgi:hypothetical protein